MGVRLGCGGIDELASADVLHVGLILICRFSRTAERI